MRCSSFPQERSPPPVPRRRHPRSPPGRRRGLLDRRALGLPPGGQLLIAGSGLDSVRGVVLLGRSGSANDRRVAATLAGPTKLSVVLPPRLRAGRIELVSRAGNTTTTTARRLKTSASVAAI